MYIAPQDLETVLVRIRPRGTPKNALNAARKAARRRVKLARKAARS